MTDHTAKKNKSAHCVRACFCNFSKKNKEDKEIEGKNVINCGDGWDGMRQKITLNGQGQKSRGKVKRIRNKIG